MDFIIREATEIWAEKIAYIHGLIWQEAYKNLISENDILLRVSEYKERCIKWRNIINDSTTLVAIADNEIIGFVACGNARDQSMMTYGEIYSLHLLEKYQGYRIGKTLLDEAINILSKNKFLSAYCWTLENNLKAQEFYKRNNAQLSTHTKQTLLGKNYYPEVMLLWNKI